MIEKANKSKIIEASGGQLDIVGETEMFVKLKVIGKVKRMKCLVLRGNQVDREILISGQMLKAWDLIHSSFRHQTVTSYVNSLTIELAKNSKSIMTSTRCLSKS